MCAWSPDIAACNCSTTPLPTIFFMIASPLSARSSGEVVDCPGSGSGNPSFGQHFVGGLQEVDDFGDADVRHGLVHDFLDFHRGDPGGQGRTEHDPVLRQGPGRR